jgi:2,4-dienoyl-CoA reductase-like NADH-dependent reductase (Old Yellow Enzyme family)
LQPVAGVGLIVAEGTQPSDDGRGYLTAPGMYHARAYRRLEEGDGGHIFIQIMHAGQAKLSRSRYLLGDQLSEADIRPLPRWCGSMPCIMATSNAIYAASWIIPRSGASPATSKI